MSTASFDNIQPSAGGTARKAVRGIAAAWANLNGTGTIALRDSENVSSVVDNGTGDYTFNFSNSMGGEYSVTFGGQISTADAAQYQAVGYARIASAATANNLRITSATISSGSPSAQDYPRVDFNLMGDLA